MLAQVWLFTAGWGNPEVFNTSAARQEACGRGKEYGEALGMAGGAMCAPCDHSDCYATDTQSRELVLACEQAHLTGEADAKTDQAPACSFVVEVFEDCCQKAIKPAWTTAISEAGCTPDSAATCW